MRPISACSDMKVWFDNGIGDDDWPDSDHYLLTCLAGADEPARPSLALQRPKRGALLKERKIEWR